MHLLFFDLGGLGLFGASFGGGGLGGTFHLGFEEVVLARVQVIALREDQVLGRKLFVGTIGGTIVAATTALGAGIHIEAVLPGEVRNLYSAYWFLPFHLAFEVFDRSELSRWS
jgi:hypothetical protein